MLALRAKIREVLIGSPTFAGQLAFVPDTVPPRARRAVYINHLSQFRKVLYPAVSIFMDGGLDAEVVFADDIVVQLDIWCAESPDEPHHAYGATGADALYRLSRGLLNQCHLRGALSSPAFAVVRCGEIATSRSEDFDIEQKLFNVSTRYRVRLIETNAEITTPN